MANPGMLVHHKRTDVDNVIQPVAELIADKRTKIQYTDLDGQLQTIDYRALTEHDPYPIPMPIDREGYGNVEDSPHHWATGQCDWLNVQSAMDRYLPTRPADQPIRLLDFGCATGRFLRHPALFGGDQIDAWGCDFSPENIQWNKTHLPPTIKTFLNNANPHLPFPDGYFDVITAFSVFTHIDQFEDAWLLELRRITRDDGLLYLTTQNDAMWKIAPTRPSYVKHLAHANKVPSNPVVVTEEMHQQPMPMDRIVFQMSESDVYNCNVWHSDNYLRTHWSRYFDIHHIADTAHGSFQSPVIMSPLGSAATATDRQAPKPR